MSTGALFWAFHQNTDTNPLDKLILIGICDQVADRTDGSALIAMEDVAIFGRCSIRGARDAIRRLRDAGLLQFRDTVVSGRSAWKKFYPLYTLADGPCPLLRGQLGEIDWEQPEVITSKELRNFITRDQRASDFIHNAVTAKGGRRAAYQAGRGHTSRPRKPKDEATGEASQGDTADAGTRNVLPGQVPGSCFRDVPEVRSGYDPEVRSGYDPEAASGATTSPLLDLFSSSSSRDEEEEEEAAISKEALELLDSLKWQRRMAGAEVVFTEPTDEEERELGALLDSAAESGRTWSQLRRHCTAAISRATTNAVFYVRTALQAEKLPRVRQPRTPLAPAATPAGPHVPAEQDSPARQEARRAIAEHARKPRRFSGPETAKKLPAGTTPLGDTVQPPAGNLAAGNGAP